MIPQKASLKNVKYDFTGLHHFVRLMDSAGTYVVKVGIFGNKTSRGVAQNKPAGENKTRKVVKGKVSTKTNAEVGLIHELGSYEMGIPQRSFLRMPLAVKSKEILADAFKGAPELIAQGKIRTILVRLGAACQKWIQIAFATRGFGTWLPNNIATIQRKGSAEPLIDTAQLRRSITSKVEEK